MEFVYRPIERLIEGAPSKKQKVTAATGGRKVLKFFVFLLVSLFLAHIFLAYFVGIDQLKVWVTRSPFEHPTSFLVMAAVTGLMMFDFGFFREQVCLVACPYGRFQSVMLDRESLIVTYDQKRGEPRGKIKRKKNSDGDVSLDVVPSGDCIDCKMCVTTCPTGIDIREGLQMECIGCAQCIDACDSVMDKVGRPRGLIRYSSQAAVEDGKWSLWRPRLFFYPALLVLFVSLFVYTLSTKAEADVTLMRAPGRDVRRARRRADSEPAPHQAHQPDRRGAHVHVQRDRARWAADRAVVRGRFTLDPGETDVADVRAVFPRDAYTGRAIDIEVTVSSETGGEIMTKGFRLLGPAGAREGGE